MSNKEDAANNFAHGHHTVVKAMIDRNDNGIDQLKFVKMSWHLW